MEIVGILKLKYDTISVSEKFKKRDFVVTTDFDSQYPQYVQMQLTQDKCGLIDSIQVGDMVKVHFNLKGREWNGPQGIKYFNTIDAWKLDLVTGTMRAEQAPPPQQTESSSVNSTPIETGNLPY